jgi:hypothetical protein
MMEYPKYINDLIATHERIKAINQRDFRKRMKNHINEVMNQTNTERVSCRYSISMISFLVLSKYRIIVMSKLFKKLFNAF